MVVVTGAAQIHLSTKDRDGDTDGWSCCSQMRQNPERTLPWKEMGDNFCLILFKLLMHLEVPRRAAYPMN